VSLHLAGRFSFLTQSMTAGQDPPGRTGEKMSIRILLIAILVGTTVSAFSQQPPSMPPIEQLYKMPAVYSVPAMDKVQIKRDIIYKSVDTEKGKPI
jgi:hypothetical protein